MKNFSYTKGAVLFAAVLGLFLLVTFGIWKTQVDHRRAMLHRHTMDVCTHAMRRIQIFIDARLHAAFILARMTDNSEKETSSGQGEAQALADAMVKNFPGYRRIARLLPNGATKWSVPKDAAAEPRPVVDRRAFSSGKQEHLSFAFTDTSNRTVFTAYFPTFHGRTLQGVLAVDFDAETLLESCFQNRIRTEFFFKVENAAKKLFQSEEDISESTFARLEAPQCRLPFEVSNQTWRLLMTPKSFLMKKVTWLADLSLPIFGTVLSLGLAVLAMLLVRRMDLYRKARDAALAEIEERKKAEAERAESENRYRNVFDAVTDGLLVMNADGVIVEANRAAAKMHGLAPNDLVGQRVGMLIVPEKRRLVKEFERRLCQDGEVRLDSQHIHRNGSRLDVEVRGAPFIKSGEELRIAIISDVTDRKKAEERHAALSRKAIAAQEEERARLSREMHDELGQILTALRLDLGLVRKQNASRREKDFLSNATMMAKKATDELRRLCKGLRPPLLDDLGLEPALQLLTDDFQTQCDDIKITVLLPEESRPMSREASLCAYRIAQESLTNVRRHSRASCADITLVYKDTCIELCITDNGRGFDMKDLGAIQGCGIQNIKERAVLAGGHAKIHSAPNEGTRIIFEAPYFMETSRAQEADGACPE